MILRAQEGWTQCPVTPPRHEPDTGEVNYPQLFKIMEDIGYDGWVGCEHHPRGATIDDLGWFQAVES